MRFFGELHLQQRGFEICQYLLAQEHERLLRAVGGDVLAEDVLLVEEALAHLTRGRLGVAAVAVLFILKPRFQRLKLLLLQQQDVLVEAGKDDFAFSEQGVSGM